MHPKVCPQERQMKRYIAMAALAAMFIPFGCEQLSIDEPSEKAPVIETFSPMSAPAGAEVIVEGLYLNNVTKAFIGDVEVEIIEKVSNTRLSIEVGQTVTGGRIRLENPYGEGESAEDFTSSSKAASSCSRKRVSGIFWSVTSRQKPRRFRRSIVSPLRSLI